MFIFHYDIDKKLKDVMKVYNNFLLLTALFGLASIIIRVQSILTALVCILKHCYYINLF